MKNNEQKQYKYSISVHVGNLDLVVPDESIDVKLKGFDISYDAVSETEEEVIGVIEESFNQLTCTLKDMI